MRLPIRARMTAWYALLLAVIVTGLGGFLVLRLRADLTGSTDTALRSASRQISDGYRVEGAVELRDVSATVLSGERAGAQAVAPDGRVLVAFGDPVARTPMVAPTAGATGPRTVVLGSAGRFRIIARPVVRRGRPELVVAAVSLAPVDRSVHQVLILLLLAGPAALLVTAGGGWWLARRSLRPVEEMTRAAEEIGLERLSDRVEEPRTGDEIAHLARTFNRMLDRVEHGVVVQRQLVADASHELRSPLAAMRAELEVSLRIDELSPAARETLASNLEEVERLSRTVDDLLTIASFDEGRPDLDIEVLDLHELAVEVAATLAPLAERRHVALEVQGEPTLTLGDGGRLRSAVRNLVENAINFSPPAGRVTLATGPEAGRARLSVLDEGPGIAPEHRDRIFERFFRADPARGRATGGSGLGLSIAREIVTAHHGAISVGPRQPRGSELRIELPRAEGVETATPGAAAGERVV